MLKSKSKIFKRFVEDVDGVLSMVTTQSNVEKEATKLKQICMIDEERSSRSLMFGQDVATTLILNEIMAKSKDE
tara:strand:- start:229 stop:450 length:222 start_codon:yes stop_codon:yes gene_type:complete